MYAIVEVQGKQYRAETGQTIKVDLLDAEAGSPMDIETVLMISGDVVKIGAPYVKNAKVKASVKAHEKGEKIIVYKYKPKKDYRKKQGHRQKYTLLTINDIIVA